MQVRKAGVVTIHFGLFEGISIEKDQLAILFEVRLH
jgi:hypothetical protein